MKVLLVWQLWTKTNILFLWSCAVKHKVNCNTHIKFDASRFIIEIFICDKVYFISHKQSLKPLGYCVLPPLVKLQFRPKLSRRKLSDLGLGLSPGLSFGLTPFLALFFNQTFFWRNFFSLAWVFVVGIFFRWRLTNKFVTTRARINHSELTTR